MMAQVKRMQAEMQKAQGELAETIVTGGAAGGAVSVELSCDNRVRSVRIAAEAVDPSDVETLEDLVAVAVNDALQRAAETAAKRMNAITGGMRIPGIS
jgi:DNA-binding YbaB/EbfC family protein